MTVQPLEKVAPDLTLEDLMPYEENRDPERKAHIVNPTMNLHIWEPGMRAQDIVNLARLQGKPVTALCGYTWVPVHNPEHFEVCETCVALAGHLMRGAGE